MLLINFAQEPDGVQHVVVYVQGGALARRRRKDGSQGAGVQPASKYETVDDVARVPWRVYACDCLALAGVSGEGAWCLSTEVSVLGEERWSPWA